VETRTSSHSAGGHGKRTGGNPDTTRARPNRSVTAAIMPNDRRPLVSGVCRRVLEPHAIQGRLAYYAVPGNADAVAAFRTQAARHWFKALRVAASARGSTGRVNRTGGYAARVRHPFPATRFDARTRGRRPMR
jgi:hypothetical protein